MSRSHNAEPIRTPSVSEGFPPVRWVVDNAASIRTPSVSEGFPPVRTNPSLMLEVRMSGPREALG
jgi:hypothetical protein